MLAGCLVNAQAQVREANPELHCHQMVVTPTPLVFNY